MMSSNGNISALLTLSAGNSPITGEFPSQRPVTRSFDVFFHLCLNKRLSKQSSGWWFETLSRPLWRKCNEKCIPGKKVFKLKWGPVSLFTSSQLDVFGCCPIRYQIQGLVQNCLISIAKVLEMLQFCAKSRIHVYFYRLGRIRELLYIHYLCHVLSLRGICLGIGERCR